MPVESRLERRLAIVVAAIPRERQQLRPAPGQRESLTDGMRHHVAVHARQADVEQHDVGTKVFELREARRTVVHHFHFVTIGAQHRAHGLGRVRVVLDHEHAARPHGLAIVARRRR